MPEYKDVGDIPFVKMKQSRALVNGHPLPKFRIYFPYRGYRKYDGSTTIKSFKMSPYTFYEK
jgi:hypothetical protein